jgi:hypothetical protein
MVVAVHICNPSYIGGISRRIVAKGSENVRTCLKKITKTKRAVGMARV